jgi:hypothetical protein
MTFDWQTEYARALTTFGGDTPTPTLEQDLLDAFQQHPQAVTNAITKIGKAYEAGKIHSPWGALKAEIPKQIQRDVKVGDGTERNRAITNAEQWLRTTGLMFDRATEIQDELFGDRGTLQPWKRDHQLVTRMTDLWEQLRPAGEATEALELERAEAWKANRDTPRKPPLTEPELQAKAHALGATT